MSYKRFTNTGCEFYPCHKTDREINCLFCFCPLYHFESCPGEFVFTEDDIKDCSNCNWIHTDEAYDIVVAILSSKVKKKR